jgi:hypothetical protein
MHVSVCMYVCMLFCVPRRQTLKGKYYGSIFVHYMPADKAIWDYNLEVRVALFFSIGGDLTLFPCLVDGRMLSITFLRTGETVSSRRRDLAGRVRSGCLSVSALVFSLLVLATLAIFLTKLASYENLQLVP